MDPITLGILFGIYVIGTAIKVVGEVQQSLAQADADRLKASQLEELSKPGGYYDQALAALNLDLTNIESGRTAAGKMLALTAAQYQASSDQTRATATQQEMQTARKGSEAAGSVAASAGAGNLGQSGSVEKRKEGIQAQTQSSLAYIQQSADRSIQQNEIDIKKATLQYEDQLRGLSSRQAQDTAEITLTQFKQNSGTQDAALLNSEADWLSTWGVILPIAAGPADVASAVLNTFKKDPKKTDVTYAAPQRFDTAFGISQLLKEY
jgi:hypothetical protein